MFRLGNFNIDEILLGIMSNFDDEVQYTVDQLSSASIEVSAESTDITDKKGNVVRTVYTSKSATFSSTNAFLHPQLMNGASGSEILRATETAPVEMPFVTTVAAGTAYTLPTGYVSTALQVIGVYGDGSNGAVYNYAELVEYGYLVTGTGVLTMPSTASDVSDSDTKADTTDLAPNYVISATRSVKDGIRLVNDAYTFPSAGKFLLYCSYVDPCDDELKPCYVLLPNFTPDPNTTISLDIESQEMDFNGNINVDFCSVDRVLYYIYFPGDETVKSGVVAA